MQDRTRLELELLEKEEYKKLLEEWNKVRSQAIEVGMVGSDCHLESFLKVGSEYLDKILNKFFDTEQSSLEAEISNQPENYFNNLQDEIITVLDKTCNLIRSKTLQTFKTSIEAHRASINEQTILKRVGTLFIEKKDIALLKMQLLRDSLDRFSEGAKPTLRKQMNVVEAPPFDFIATKELIPILQRDYLEIASVLSLTVLYIS